jgi:uncharacterized protein YdiU (UPF0061 family)
MSSNPFLSLDYEPAFQSLGEDYADPVPAAEFPQTILRFRNDALLPRLDLEPAAVSDGDFIEAFGQFRGREPLLAMRYHGYQFGVYNPQLGDGRGFLYGQVRDRQGNLLDLATKGSGQTPYSRGGDGRLTLKGGVREVLASEMLARLGVRTSRCLSLIETGEALWRGDEPSPTRSSVMVRLGTSHIRFGTFERLNYVKRPDLVQKLLNHVIEHYYPHLQGEADPYPLFYRELVERVATLSAQWMVAGFCHAVLNTDNMLVTGESFDYGPFAFIPTYDPSFTAAYFDHDGRYCYGNQPGIGKLNLEWLQRPLSLAIAPETLAAALEAYAPAYYRAYREGMERRLGWEGLDPTDSDDLVEATVQFLGHAQVPYADFFARLRSRFDPRWREDLGQLTGLAGGEAIADAPPFWWDLLAEPPNATVLDYWGKWCQIYHRLLQHQSTADLAAMGDRLAAANPLVTVVRPEIEAVWEAITVEDDWQPFNTLLKQIWE